MAQLNTVKIPCAYAGLDTESAPDNVLKGCAPEHQNWLLHTDGKMVVRGPLYEHTAMGLTVASPEIIAGCWTLQDKALVSFVEPSATAQFEPHTAYYKRNTNQNNIAQPRLAMKHIDFETNVVTTVTAGTTAGVIARDATTLGNYVYGVGYGFSLGLSDYDTILPYNDRVPRTTLLRWDGTTTTPAAMGSAPRGALAVASHYERLFVLGSTTERNTLFFTDVGGPTGLGVAADWIDNTSGLASKIVIGAETLSDFGVGLAKAGQDLVILKRRSLYVLSGYSASTFNVRQISDSIGCVDGRSIVDAGEGCYFMSQDGFMYFDGAELINVSRNISTELTNLIDVTIGDNGSNGAFCVAERLNDNYILISLGAINLNTRVMAGGYRKAYLFHMPTRRWSRFNSIAIDDGQPRWIGRTSRGPFLIDGSETYKADRLTNVSDGIQAKDIRPSSPATFNPITAIWYSELVNLASMPFMTQLHRLFINYACYTDDGIDGLSFGFRVSLFGGNADELLASTALPDMPDARSTGLFRRLFVQDLFAESNDVQLRILYQPDADDADVYDTAIFDCYIETQQSRQRRTS